MNHIDHLVERLHDPALPPKKNYGWHPDLHEDGTRYKANMHMNLTQHLGAQNLKLPSSISLRSHFPQVFDQQTIGSCTANSILAAYEYEMGKQGEHIMALSRLFLYYVSREFEGTTKTDSGAQIKDVVSVLGLNPHFTGVCYESYWPYDCSKLCVKPPPKAYADAKLHHLANAYNVHQTLNDIKTALASGYAVVFGFVVFPSFETIDHTGIMPMPHPDTEEALGGHAVVAVGYNDATHCVSVRNSWGVGWGDGGYFYMPYDFIINPVYCSDFWALKKVSDKE